MHRAALLTTDDRCSTTRPAMQRASTTGAAQPSCPALPDRYVAGPPLCDVQSICGFFTGPWTVTG